LKKTKSLYLVVGLSLLLSLLTSACNLSNADATPTFSVELAQTLAVATFSSGQTQTAIAMPTNTSTPTATSSPTSTITLAVTNTSSAPIGSGVGIQPTSSCYSMAFVADVTIPDNSNMKPGQSFTKTWRVRNNGTCAWDSGFKLNFIGGEAMGGATLTLDKAISPGTETELSVGMTAPNTTGSHRGNWRMANVTGTNFGDEVYVVIVVSGSASTTATSTTTSAPVPATGTPTATETPTETPIP
jgi:hypothetical protein